jgi:hypothetical protein
MGRRGQVRRHAAPAAPRRARGMPALAAGAQLQRGASRARRHRGGAWATPGTARRRTRLPRGRGQARLRRPPQAATRPRREGGRHAERAPATFLAFGVLHLDGRSTRELPYERRRELLLDLALDGPGWRTPRHFVAETDRVLAATREHGLEGVVAKRLGSPYLPGARNGAWVKYKHRRTESFLVSGWSRRAPPSRGPAARTARTGREPRACRERPARARRRPG